MSLVSYMGTKAALAAPIASAIQTLPDGPLLDLFAGMSAVGRSVGATRNVWLNDVQAFSKVASEFQFLPGEPTLQVSATMRIVLTEYKRHLHSLTEIFSEQVEREKTALSSEDWSELARHEQRLRDSSASAVGNPTVSEGQIRGSYDLFSRSYSGTYFGVSQCCELDALRKGIDAAVPHDDSANAVLRRWMITSLGAAASRCSNSTGHFAQYLTISAQNVHRVRAQRRRSLKSEWIKRLRLARRVGSDVWRRGNRVFSSDACSLVKNLGGLSAGPAVIYADPPYTADQYSRYYHLLDTLVLYDYPELSGKGRYRNGRFVSDWSLASRVESCFGELISGAANLGSALVISYPLDGLFKDSEIEIPALLRQHFKKVVKLTPVPHKHSTMGASKGKQVHDVVEQLFVAQNC